MFEVFFFSIVGFVCVVGTVLYFSIWRKHKGSIPVGITLLSVGLMFLFGSHIISYDLGNGHLANISQLDEKMIYQVAGEMKVADKEKMAIALADARGKILHVESDPLPEGTDFVKQVKDNKGNYRLEPVKLPTKSSVERKVFPMENTQTQTVAPKPAGPPFAQP